MSKQDLIGIKIQPIEVGDKLYVFKQGTQHSNHLLISSHGGSSKNKMLVPKWTTLHFYGPHGKLLTDPGAKDLLLSENVEYEQIGPGKPVVNYPLSKYQQKKGTKGKETYETIANCIGDAKKQKDNLVKFTNGFVEKYRKANPRAKEVGLREFQEWLLQDCNGNEQKFALVMCQLLSAQMSDVRIVDMDILTVRNRIFRSDPTLSDVFDQLNKKNLRYPHIHCSFCRPIEGDDSSYKSSKKDTERDQARSIIKGLLKEAGIKNPSNW